MGKISTHKRQADKSELTSSTNAQIQSESPAQPLKDVIAAAQVLVHSSRDDETHVGSTPVGPEIDADKETEALALTLGVALTDGTLTVDEH